MIVIKIELHSAITGKITSLGEAVICNQGVEYQKRRFDYVFQIARKGKTVRDVLTGKSKPTREAVVSRWPRDQKTVWQLLQRALNEAYGE